MMRTADVNPVHNVYLEDSKFLLSRKDKHDLISSSIFASYLWRLDPSPAVKRQCRALGARVVSDDELTMVNLGEFARKIFPGTLNFRSRFRRDPSFDMGFGIIAFGMRVLQEPYDEHSKEKLRFVVQGLEKMSVKDKNGLCWKHPFVKKGQLINYVNLGVARGMAGVIAFLSLCASLGLEKKRCLRLLDGAMRFMMATDKATGETGFPAMLGHRIQSANYRASYCYGDPGIGYMIILAGRRCNRSDWTAFGEKVFYRGLRKNLKAAQLRSPYFFYGTGGVAHLASRMAQLTGDKRDVDFADLWWRRTEKYYVRHYQGEIARSDFTCLLHRSVLGICVADWSHRRLIDSHWDAMYGISNPISGEIL